MSLPVSSLDSRNAFGLQAADDTLKYFGRLLGV